MMDAPTTNPPDRTRQTVVRPLASSLAVLAGLIRLVPHPWNFTPVGALGLYGGARLPAWQAFTLPLAVMIVTDLVLKVVLNLPAFNPFVYAAFVVYVLLGRLLTRTESPWKIGTVSLVGSVQFFLLSNFGAWLGLSRGPEALYP